jgi:hypothetical protein
MDKMPLMYYCFIPAPGEDYDSFKAARTAFLAGKDFRVSPSPTEPYTRCSIRDFKPGCECHLHSTITGSLGIVEVPS